MNPVFKSGAKFVVGGAIATGGCLLSPDQDTANGFFQLSTAIMQGQTSTVSSVSSSVVGYSNYEVCFQPTESPDASRINVAAKLQGEWNLNGQTYSFMGQTFRFDPPLEVAQSRAQFFLSVNRSYIKVDTAKLKT